MWDRAVELFYQIKGGTVDYGKQHSARHGHSRFGRTFPGLFPEWDAECGEFIASLAQVVDGTELSRLRAAIIDSGPSLAASAAMGKRDVAKVGRISDSITKNVGPPVSLDTG